MFERKVAVTRHAHPIGPLHFHIDAFLIRHEGGHTRPSHSPGVARPMLRALIALTLTCLLQPAFADERAQTQQQLDATRQDIGELKKLLGKIQAEKSGVQKDLRSTETEIGKLEKQVEELQKELKKSEGELLRLDSEKKKLNSAKIEQQRLIAIQARAAYQGGRQEYLKMLLNQQNPEKPSADTMLHGESVQSSSDEAMTFVLSWYENLDLDAFQSYRPDSRR